jgi:hypothetical protein
MTPSRSVFKNVIDSASGSGFTADQSEAAGAGKWYWFLAIDVSVPAAGREAGPAGFVAGVAAIVAARPRNKPSDLMKPSVEFMQSMLTEALELGEENYRGDQGTRCRSAITGRCGEPTSGPSQQFRHCQSWLKRMWSMRVQVRFTR